MKRPWEDANDFEFFMSAAEFMKSLPTDEQLDAQLKYTDWTGRDVWAYINRKVEWLDKRTELTNER